MSYRLLWSAIQSAVVLVSLSGYAQAGLIEICKDASPAGSLSGLATFSIAGQPGTVAAPVGACSSAIQLPNGFATITELVQPGTTLIGVSTFPSDRLISFDATTESAVVLIVAGDISTETVITFTNAPITGVPEPGTGVVIWPRLDLLGVPGRAEEACDIAGVAFSTTPTSRRRHQSH